MLKNNAFFNYYDLAALFGEESLLNISTDKNFKGVSTDSREVQPGNIFVALEGSNIDGHSKIQEAISKGALLAIAKKNKIAYEWLENKLPLVLVDDTIKALGQLASYYRRRFDFPVIAIGGSNGKTTTKEIIAHLLSQRFNVLKTYENYNNQIGVPQMLFQFDTKFDISVIEIGTNEPGEISILSEMISPTHGLITNIAEEHLEKLIDLWGVEAEETHLFGYLHKHDGFCFVNADDERLIKYGILLENKMTYGFNELADLKAELITNDDLTYQLILNFEGRCIRAKINEIGISTTKNALAASAVALKFGLSDNEIINGLETYKHPRWQSYGRMSIERYGSITIINDTYNANPASMLNALETLANFKSANKKIAALGDMLELGENSIKYHIEILNEAIKCSDSVYLTGELMLSASKKLNSSKIIHFKSKDELSQHLANNLETSDVLLVKGSRGMKMEEVIIKIKDWINSNNSKKLGI